MGREIAIHLCPSAEMKTQYKVVDGYAEVPLLPTTLMSRLCPACKTVVTGFYFRERQERFVEGIEQIAASAWKTNPA